MSNKSKPKPRSNPNPRPLTEEKGRTIPKPPSQIRPTPKK